MTNYERINGIYTFNSIEKGDDVLVLEPQSDRYTWIGKAEETWIPRSSMGSGSIDVKVVFEDGSTEEYQRRAVRPVTITH